MWRILLVIGAFYPVVVFGQLDQSAFTATGRGGVATTFATDYQSIGINPANLGIQKTFRDPRYTFGFGEGNLHVASDLLTGYELLKAMASRQGENFTHAQKVQAAQKFADKAFRLSSDFMYFGAHHQFARGKQGIAFSIRDRVQLTVKLSRLISEFMFLGATSSYFPNLVLNDDGPNDTISNPRFNNPDFVWEDNFTERVIGGFYDSNSPLRPQSYAQLLNGSRISSSWIREFNIAYGGQLVDSYNFSLYAGFGLRYILGYAFIGIEARNNQFVQSNVSLSPSFGVNISNVGPKLPTANLAVRLFNPEPIGQGLGMDFGITMNIKRRVYLGASLTNVGSIVWSGNSYAIINDSLRTFQGSGLNDFNILRSSPETFSFVGNGSPFRFEKVSQRTIDLPTLARFGISYEYYKLFHIGFDVAIPLNEVSGNIIKPVWAFGGDYRLLKTLRISSGLNLFGVNSTKLNIPAGVTYLARKGWWEAGIATQDVSSFVASLGKGSLISFAMGTLRFKI